MDYTPNSEYQSLGSYGIIGDLSTVALIGPNASIDFMSFPNFDSPTVFAKLLDSKIGGKFEISPITVATRQHKIYLPNTNILISRFLFDDGVAEVSDFMPISEPGRPRMIVRRVKLIRGSCPFKMILEPRFDYARAKPKIQRDSEGIIIESSGSDKTALRLRTPISIDISDSCLNAEFNLQPGETTWFVLEQVLPGKDSPCKNPEFISESFKETVNFWRGWIARSSYRGRWREMVNRSALTLKLLTSQAYGSIVAAPTFSLPETLGGPRNWDYRYTWIRDASFTIYALMRLGFMDEARSFMYWVQDRIVEVSDQHPLQVMYRIDGSKDLPEEILSHMEGYHSSKPVRIGNAAQNQLQLDIYGELLDSIYLFDKHAEPLSHDLWNKISNMVNWVSHNWNQPDESIWEVRGGQKEFLYSRVMCWVALDRALRLAQRRSFPAPITEWINARDQIYKSVFKDFWSPTRKAFVQYKGANSVDASCLLMPLIKFISPVDPKWLSTLAAVEEELVEDSFVYRYKYGYATDDGLSGQEGTFSMCSFWYVEALARSGNLEKARYYFEKMLSNSNRLGLYAEQIGPDGEALGNFPQAFTHIALISAAFDLDRRLNEAGIKI